MIKPTDMVRAISLLTDEQRSQMARLCLAGYKFEAGVDNGHGDHGLVLGFAPDGSPTYEYQNSGDFLANKIHHARLHMAGKSGEGTTDGAD